MPLNSPRPGRWVAEVCENGHGVSPWVDHSPEDHRAFCEQCGAPTVQACPNCETAIPGWLKDGMAYTYDPPAFCGSCGKPYPEGLCRHGRRPAPVEAPSGALA
ncbi:MAG: DUF2321 domain-containing protein [Chloroflexi bacterium]|nr:DUF2321 domain-containing protein [Chloroflexota bacterium]